MSLLLYGILSEAGAPPFLGVTGVGGHRLEAVHAAGLLAVVSATDGLDREVESAMCFGDVIESIHKDRTLIPMRYGCVLPDRIAVKVLLEERQAIYKARLSELEGCVEMGIRIPAEPLEDSPARPDVANGRDYLQMRREIYSANEKAERAADALDVALQGLYCKRVAEQGVFAGRPVYSIYYLVERPRLASFRAAFDGMPVSDLRRWMSGPWPPYNFVTPLDPFLERIRGG